METETLRQVTLKSGEIGMTCWVDDRPDLKPGAVITLETYIDPDRKWTVEEIYDEKDFDKVYELSCFTTGYTLKD